MINAKLTIEELRKFEGMEHIPEDEAINIIDTLYELCLIVYEEFVNNPKSDITEP